MADNAYSEQIEHAEKCLTQWPAWMKVSVANKRKENMRLSNEAINKCEKRLKAQGVPDYYDSVKVCEQARKYNKLREGIEQIKRELCDSIDELENFIAQDGTPQYLKHKLRGTLNIEAVFAYKLSALLED